MTWLTKHHPTIYRFTDSVKVNIREDFSIDFSQFRLWIPSCSRAGLALLLLSSAF